MHMETRGGKERERNMDAMALDAKEEYDESVVRYLVYPFLQGFNLPSLVIMCSSFGFG